MDIKSYIPMLTLVADDAAYPVLMKLVAAIPDQDLKDFVTAIMPAVKTYADKLLAKAA